MEAPVILFDGVCNLCNASVQFVIDHDSASRYRFAALQSEAAHALLRRRGVDPAEMPDSIALVEGERVHHRSDAALRIAAHLDGAWPLLRVFAVVPRPIRDRVYDWIAANRYRWFGRQESCRIPTPDEAARFLPDGVGA